MINGCMRQLLNSNPKDEKGGKGKINLLVYDSKYQSVQCTDRERL